ncbi:multiple epidermal growth factor-like domains protein 10 [Ruditapes philippinarum]|uniref:multiple epidermal growth factor-like domains protein 10 n=1 Tax=Ruditapes philippinarum TaxID=129788 RepID=UPI00295A6F83|nr:multiple epidermal growth factor-like domains protein 10 [Ruditapes philippinarum]
MSSRCTEQCLGNCKTCAIGNQCIECKPGYFTDTCNNKCGKGCVNNTCSSISGECTCRSTHFVEGKCDKCSDDKYGDECSITCPSYCGICEDTHCLWCINTVRYGTFCRYKCSTGCNEGKCNKGDGHCMRGCKLGYIGEKCDSCSPGLYSHTCDLICAENCYTCISKTNCTQCKSGFYGETCTKTCPSGCNGNCSLSDGRCIVCKPELFGEFCNSTCKDGTYGVNCSKLCQDVDSYCQECHTGENGIYCGCRKCNDTYYSVIPVGYNYNICILCPHNCKDKICNTTGSCKEGCVRGKWGDECNTDCKTNCVECNQKDGKCSDVLRTRFQRTVYKTVAKPAIQMKMPEPVPRIQERV